MGTLKICDNDSIHAILAKTLFALVDLPIVMDEATWEKLIPPWACSYGFDSVTVADSEFTEQVSDRALQQHVEEMRKRQAILYNGQWYGVQLIE